MKAAQQELELVINEIRKLAELTIRAAGEGGKKVDLVKLTNLLDAWRFKLENVDKAIGRQNMGGGTD